MHVCVCVSFHDAHYYGRIKHLIEHLSFLPPQRKWQAIFMLSNLF